MYSSSSTTHACRLLGWATSLTPYRCRYAGHVIPYLLWISSCELYDFCDAYFATHIESIRGKREPCCDWMVVNYNFLLIIMKYFDYFQ